MNQWKLTVGMEIHVELETKTKMFCGCPNDPFHAEANTNVCPVCYGLPGALPLLNKEAVMMVVRLGQALKAEVATESFWARKNYFYPDLPKGYQISQSAKPLMVGGKVTIDGADYHLHHAHLEEDAGKLMHAPDKTHSLVNYNRAGVPLLEIVTEPDFHTAEAAKRFCQELQRIMRSLKISTADMEKGQLRCEANISVSQTDELGTKVEVKNINSFRAVEKAIEYEFERQVKALEAGETIQHETRSWQETDGKTVVMRSKETSADYRYFPEPDLPAVSILVGENAEHVLPDEKRQQLADWGISDHEIARTIVDRGYFEDFKELYHNIVIREFKDPGLMQLAANISLGNPEFIKLQPEEKLALIELTTQNGWTKETVAEIITKAIGETKSIAELASEFTHGDDLTEVIEVVSFANQKAVADYRSGKENSFNFLVGQVMAKTQGRANINTVREELKKALQ